MRFTISGILTLAFYFTYGQSCSITADSVVCKNELLAFSAVASSGANSYNWSFSDGGSANTQNISKSFSTYGPKYITLTVGFSGGGTCVARDTIMVHDLPAPSFSLAGSKYCFSDHEICLTDNSTMGATTTGYDQRIILWGDGANNTNGSPANGNKICYSSYAYPDTFELVIEVTNDKGCEAIWRQDVVVEHEHIPSFEPDVGAANCATQTVCFDNDSTKPDDVKRFIWYFGDGSVDSTKWSRPCHGLPESKKYTATFTVELENGCTRTTSRDYTTAFQEVLPDPYVTDTGMCYPEEFQCVNAPIFFANYYWYLIDVNGDTVDNTVGQIGTLEPPYPGTYFVAGRIKLGDCDTSSPWIQVESLGIKAEFLTLNHDQCNSMDTIYTVNTSYMHPDAIPKWLWVFYDTLSPSCSRSCSTAANNCFYDTTGINSKHLYEVHDCYYPTLIAYDEHSGCIDSFIDTVSRISQEYILFEADPGRRCFGAEDEYKIAFTHNLCGGSIYINPDTNCYDSSTFFLYEDGWLYASVCDSNNWVSPGFIVVQGDNKVYRSSDTTDYYMDNNQICVDTVWYPEMFQLHPSPSAGLSLSAGKCLDVDAEWTFSGAPGVDSSLRLVRFNWSDPTKVEEILLDKDTFPEVKHTYTEPGAYATFIYVEDTNGCFISRGMEFPPIIIQAGYFNTFKVDSVICPGVEFVARDSILYWFDGTHYWRDTSRPEYVAWDFGDGNGFSTIGALPAYTYNDKGFYTIRMATRDVNGCVDTVSQDVIVGGVNAAIKTSETEFLCDQIVQFQDSSWSNLSGADDIINHYYWDFGDGTNTSQLKDPFHYYDKNGYFTLTHAVSNAKGCSDTVRIQIYMKGPQPYFDIISDTAGCAPFDASFQLTGVNISEFVLHLNDPQNNTISSKSDTLVNFRYSQPGVYDIFLSGTDSFYNKTSGNYYTCTEWFPDSTQDAWPQRRIIVLPTPPADIEFDKPVCPGIPVEFRSRSDTIYSVFSWLIDTVYMDSAGSPVNHTFQDTGTYLVYLYPQYEAPPPYYVACYDTVQKQVNVSFVRAGFVHEQIDNCSGFEFRDSSENASVYSWDFGHPISGDENISTEQNPEHSYTPDTGTFRVCLTVTNDSGCVDQFCKDIHSTYRVYADFYNVFTPGSDGVNDLFAPQVDGEDLYDLKIFNRWGELIFSSDSKLLKWDGTDMTTGDPLPGGTYFYILKYRFECTGEEDTVHGTIELIRN